MSERVANWPNTGCTEQTPREFVLRCGCGRIRTWPKTLPASRTREVGEREGWAIGKRWRQARCPDCSAHQRKEREAKESNRKMQDTQKEGYRVVFATLLEHYDVPRQGYSDGWNDGRVSKETGRALPFVAKIRDEHFGPAEDQRLGDLRAQIAAARKDAVSEGAEIRALAEESQRKWIERLDELGKQVARLAQP